MFNCTINNFCKYGGIYIGLFLLIIPFIGYSQSIYLSTGYTGSYSAEYDLYRNSTNIEMGLKFDVEDIGLGIALGHNGELYYKGTFSATFSKKIEPSLSVLFYDGYYESAEGRKFGAEVNILCRMKHVSPRFDLGFDNKRVYFNINFITFLTF